MEYLNNYTARSVLRFNAPFARVLPGLKRPDIVCLGLVQWKGQLYTYVIAGKSNCILCIALIVPTPTTEQFKTAKLLLKLS